MKELQGWLAAIACYNHLFIAIENITNAADGSDTDKLLRRLHVNWINKHRGGIKITAADWRYSSDCKRT